jgi:hypothetical protein
MLRESDRRTQDPPHLVGIDERRIAQPIGWVLLEVLALSIAVGEHLPAGSFEIRAILEFVRAIVVVPPILLVLATPLPLFLPFIQFDRIERDLGTRLGVLGGWRRAFGLMDEVLSRLVLQLHPVLADRRDSDVAVNVDVMVLLVVCVR